MESPLCPPPDPEFRLIETFRWEPDRGILRRDRHLARLMRSALRLGIVPRCVEDVLAGLTGDGPLRVRLSVDAKGEVAVTTAPFAPLPNGAVWRVALADQRLDADNPWLGVKTTERQLYDSARAQLPKGVDELIFFNQRGELCEGTITNLFADFGEGLLTPPLHCGLLSGVLRQELIDTGGAREAVLSAEDLTCAHTVFMGNSLRGLIRARLV